MPFVNNKLHFNMTNKNRKYEMVQEILTSPDYYCVLGIRQEASKEEIIQAFKEKSRVCAPVKFVPASSNALKSFRILVAAYNTLSDPIQREAYDESISLKGLPSIYPSVALTIASPPLKDTIEYQTSVESVSIPKSPKTITTVALTTPFQPLSDLIVPQTCNESYSDEKTTCISSPSTLMIPYQHSSDTSEKQTFDELRSHKECHGNACYCEVVQQLINELCEGKFKKMRSFINEINEAIPTAVQFSDNTIDQIEAGYSKVYLMLKASKHCFDITKHFYNVLLPQLVLLYKMQQELGSLSYFSVWKRTQLTITIGKTLIQLPYTLYISM